MGHYVYQYLHPDYGHLYCGRTNSLDKRIYEHNNCKDDNIPREYEELLKESIIMYIELQNKAQEISVEAYCIDKYKPYLNKALKCGDCEDSVLEMKLPKWKRYEPKNLKYKQQLCSIREEKEKIIEDILNTEEDIKQKKDDLNKMKFKLNKICYEIKAQNSNKCNNILFAFYSDDIRWFYEHCENKEVRFHSEIYNKLGEISLKGTIWYNSQKKELVLEYYSERNKVNPFVITENEISFDMHVCMLREFYPDINIYPELFAALSSKKDELLIKNTVYDIKDLIEKYRNSWFVSVDKNIRVLFKNGELHSCNVKWDVFDNGKRDIYGLNNIYDWDIDDGLCLYNEGKIVYKKEDIDTNVRDYIFSCKYYSPDRCEKEEEYCNEMLAKYKVA